MLPLVQNANEFTVLLGQILSSIVIGYVLLSVMRNLMATNEAKMKQRKPPGPILQYINKLLHREPFSFIFHGIFWSCVLIVLCPLAGIAAVLLSLMKAIQFIVRPKPNIVDAKNSNVEMGVYITGCDSGFGKDLSLALSKKGFFVFSGCLTESGMEQYKDVQNNIALKVDVTNNDDSEGAASFVKKWLEEPSEKKRVLHCIVNNAGIGNVGLIDWCDLSTFRKLMDVNCFGTIRTVKSFLPIFKKQAFANTHPDARIVNVISLAGLISTTGACAYSSSKHAAYAFTTCLRLEMKAFKVPVVSVNPSWHQTPLSDSTGDMLESVWSRLTPETQQEYGEEYFSSFSDAFLDKKKKEWSADVVEKELISCVEGKNPPDQVIIGSDAKYTVMILKLLPVWLQMKVFDYITPTPKAAKMES